MLSYLFNKYKIQSAIIIFLVSYLTIILINPNFCFDNDGNIMQFGLGYKNKTIIPIWLLSIILAIFSYFMIYYYLHLKTIYF